MKATLNTLKQETKCFKPSDEGTIGLACSGGMDSMLLLHMIRLTKIPVHVLHFNHRWRSKESDEDAAWLKRFCDENKISCSIGKAKTSGISSEGKARDDRWKFLIKEVQKRGLHSIWTAHHADDLVETFLLQLMRGAGSDGLAGLKQQRSREGVEIIRPFLHITRTDLAQVAQSEKLSWKEDSTNQSLDFFRNRIRHQLLPMMSELSGREASPLILRTAQLLADENSFWEDQMSEAFPSKVALKELKDKHIAFQRRYLRGWLLSQGISAPSYDQIEAIRKMITEIKPAKINLSKNKYCRRRAGLLFLE